MLKVAFTQSITKYIFTELEYNLYITIYLLCGMINKYFFFKYVITILIIICVYKKYLLKDVNFLNKF